MKTQKMLMLTSMMFAVLLLAPKAEAVIVINEFLADPPSGLIGDANRDGVRSSSDDEFVELFNTSSQSLDLSTWSLWDSTALRHQFTAGTMLEANSRAVVFGGGTPTDLPGLVLIASTGRLSLNNSSDSVIFKNGLGEIIDSVMYGSEASMNQSLTRFPEGNLPFQLHSKVSSAGLLFSPGTNANGQLTKPETVPSVPEPSTWTLIALSLLTISAWHHSRKRLLLGSF